MSKSLKIEIDVSMYELVEELKSLQAIDDVVNKVNNVLKIKEKKQIIVHSLRLVRMPFLFFGRKKKKFHQPF